MHPHTPNDTDESASRHALDRRTFFRQAGAAILGSRKMASTVAGVIWGIGLTGCSPTPNRPRGLEVLEINAETVPDPTTRSLMMGSASNLRDTFGIELYAKDPGHQLFPNTQDVEPEKMGKTLGNISSILSTYYDPALIKSLQIGILFGTHPAARGATRGIIGGGCVIFIDVRRTDGHQNEYIHHELFHALIDAFPDEGEALLKEFEQITLQNGYQYGKESNSMDPTVFRDKRALEDAEQDAAICLTAHYGMCTCRATTPPSPFIRKCWP